MGASTPQQHFYKWLGTGAAPRVEKNSKQETDQTVLTVTKALNKMINCTCRAKKWRGTTKKKSSALRRTCAPHTLAFKFVPAILAVV